MMIIVPKSNLCPRCKERDKEVSGYCRKCYNERSLEYYYKHRKQIKDRAKNYYLKNKTKILASRKRWRQKIRLNCLIHYGGDPPKCACCDEDRIEFLTIDHINGGGVKHRKKAGITGTFFYVWLRKNGYPEGMRVLCYNCNCSFGHYGYCPHQKEIGECFC